MIFDRELFETRHGRVIMDEDLSDKMYPLLNHITRRNQTRQAPALNGLEMGMANLDCCTHTKLATARNIRAGIHILRGAAKGETRELFSWQRRLRTL